MIRMVVVFPQSYRRGYTVLELMISLVLLATLMSVAWAILGAYRNAEQRGWNQAYQMAMIRMTRSQIEADVAHFMEPHETKTPSESQSGGMEVKRFQGDATSFSADVLPSFDPLPWLDEITRQAEPLTSTSEARSLLEKNTSVALDPLTVYHLRYELVAEGLSDADDSSSRLQRQLTPLDRWSDANSSNAADKLLTSEDLYRMNEEDEDSPQRKSGEVTTTNIRNLVNARFRYSDGSEWTAQWDSRSKGHLPKAIELSFDFLPALAQPNSEAVAEDSQDDTLAGDALTALELDSESLAVAEPTVSVTEDEDALEREVRIVVLVPGSSIQRGPK